MIGKNKIKILLIILIVIFIAILGFVSAETLVSDADVEYDSEIPEVFNDQTLAEERMWDYQNNYKTLDIINDQTWLRVMVRLKDESGIIIVGTKEEKIELMRQRDEWFEPVIDEVLATLSEADVKVAGKLFNGFGAHITKKGFDKLISNPAVRKINWPKTGASGTLGDGVEYDLEILEEFDRTSEVAIIVKLYDQNMIKVDEVLATLTEQQFKLEGKFVNGRGFHGNITKNGFDSLINNSDVKGIYLVENLYAVEDNLEIDSDEIETEEEGFPSGFEEEQEEPLPEIVKEKEEVKSKVMWPLIGIFAVVLVIIIYFIIRKKK